uniref:Alpha-2-macroglobulin bait region domain-containing protein n=1 Tax=Leptobrachium leishanense TaxID=445787 RepID=A0A8C5QAW8_9ANUR
MNPSSVCLLRCFLRPPHGGGFTSGLIPGAADNETCSLVEGRSLLRCRLYAVIFPSEIRVLSPQLACLHVEGASGETSVQLTLTSSNGNTSLIDKSFQLDSLFTCIPFQVLCTINVVIKMPQETLFKQTKVLLKKERSSVVVQTDKPIYKPGQTGKHREGVSLNVKFQGMSCDPANNRIGQWLNVTLNEGISEFSLPLSAEPTLGDYKVWVKGKVSTFSVQEYVLPKFEIRLHLPKAVMFNQETIPVKVCGKYTYGKPVQGAYRIKVCREYARPYLSHVPGLRALCTEINGKVRRHAVYSGGRAGIFRDFMFSLLISCLAICRVLHGDHPLSSTQARTTEEQTQPILRLVVPDHSNAYLYLSSFYSRSKSFLKLRSLGNVLPCEGQQEVQMDYIINGAKLDMETKKLDFHYLLISKGSLWKSGTIEIPITSDDLTGSTSFNFPLTPDVSPNLRVLAYILLPDGEIAADSAKFTVQRCFKNKVSVGFTPDEVLPGSDVSLQIQADPGSLCGLRVVDHSVILMKPEKELTADKVRYSSMFLLPPPPTGTCNHMPTLSNYKCVSADSQLITRCSATGENLQ